MAFTEVEKDQLRTYMTRAPIFQLLDVRFQAAVDSIESLNDGGAAEDQIREWLGKLVAYDNKLDELLLSGCTSVFEVNGIKKDERQTIAMIRRRCRELVGRIGVKLSGRPITDAFSGAEMGDFGSHYTSIGEH